MTHGFDYMSKQRKKIKSFTLDNLSIKKLQAYADKETKGNASKALILLIQKAIPVTFEDYEHHAPEEHRNWKGSGKCNPRLKSYPCVQCWGLNATVNVIQRMNKNYEVEEVVTVENS